MKKQILHFLIIGIVFLFTSCDLTKDSTTGPEVSDRLVPYNPYPPDGQTEELLVVTLKWESDGDKFDVYFDKKNSPSKLLVSNIENKSVVVTGLDYLTKYYWKVVSKKNGVVKEGTVWNFSTLGRPSPIGGGYVLLKNTIETSTPSNVNVLFQVVDLNNQGITDLTEADFEVYEDGLPISPSESELKIVKKEDLYYRIKTVLMLDNSTSLADSINAIRLAAADFIRNLVPYQEVALYSFSEKPILLQDFTSDKNILIDALSRYQLGFPTTNLYGAVVEGANKWKDVFKIGETVQGYMVLFTDGRDTQGSTSLNQALNAIHNKIVFTIGLGKEIEPDILMKLGTGGFFNVNSTTEIESRLSEIQDKIVTYANSFYLLTYKSPKRGNFNHILTIRVKNNPYTGSYAQLSGTFNSGSFFSAKLSGNL
jgi:VWFA-related protein